MNDALGIILLVLLLTSFLACILGVFRQPPTNNKVKKLSDADGD